MKSLGICLIGCGRAGMIHGLNYKHRIENAHMAACVDVVEKAARDAAEQLGADAWFTDYREAIKRPDVDCVVVVSPTALHKQIVCDCAAAGKHVFCEKPMAINACECEEMIEACRKAGVKLQIGFMRRFDKSFRQAKEALESGAIGDLVMIRSNTRGPSKPQRWMYDISQSNGILAEVNSHDLDTIRWFAGSEIRELFAVAGNYRNKEIREEFPDYYDNVVMNGTFENGVQFSIDGATYVQYGYDARVELVGTKGVIQVGRTDESFIRVTAPETGSTTPYVASWRTLFVDAYLAEDKAFVRSVLEDTEPSPSGVDGMMAVRAVEAGNKSIKTNTIVFP